VLSVIKAIRAIRPRLAALACIASLAAACGGAEQQAAPVATPRVTVNHTAAPAGSPLEITYTFVVADGAQIDEDYVVFVHVVDVDGERMWDDDHEPRVPTTQWKPGQTIEYTRTVFVPVFPYVGEATMRVGLYSRTRPERLPLNGEHTGQNAYRVATLQLLPQTDNLLMVFKDGWHRAEVAGDDAAIEWQWTRKEATLSFRNPRKSAVFYLDVDSPGMQHHGPQQVQVVLEGQVVDEFTLKDEQRVLRRVQLTPAQIGEAEMADLRIRVDKSWVPAQVPTAASGDKRELGVRVFHAFVDHR
jgi:hypothetical protein